MKKISMPSSAISAPSHIRVPAYLTLRSCYCPFNCCFLFTAGDPERVRVEGGPGGGEPQRHIHHNSPQEEVLRILQTQV